jgi:hypothetical protein
MRFQAKHSRRQSIFWSMYSILDKAIAAQNVTRVAHFQVLRKADMRWLLGRLYWMCVYSVLCPKTDIDIGIGSQYDGIYSTSTKARIVFLSKSDVHRRKQLVHLYAGTIHRVRVVYDMSLFRLKEM